MTAGSPYLATRHIPDKGSREVFARLGPLWPAAIFYFLIRGNSSLEDPGDRTVHARLFFLFCFFFSFFLSRRAVRFEHILVNELLSFNNCVDGGLLR